MLLKLPGHALDSIAQFSSFGDTSRYSLFVFTWRMQLSFVCRAWRAQFEDEFSVERVAIHLNASLSVAWRAGNHRILERWARLCVNIERYAELEPYFTPHIAECKLEEDGVNTWGLRRRYDCGGGDLPRYPIEAVARRQWDLLPEDRTRLLLLSLVVACEGRGAPRMTLPTKKTALGDLLHYRPAMPTDARPLLYTLSGSTSHIDLQRLEPFNAARAGELYASRRPAQSHALRTAPLHALAPGRATTTGTRGAALRCQSRIERTAGDDASAKRLALPAP